MWTVSPHGLMTFNVNDCAGVFNIDCMLEPDIVGYSVVKAVLGVRSNRCNTRPIYEGF